MKDLIISIFGEYVPTGIGISGLDFPYIFGCILFIIVVYCFFRILGGFIDD